MMMRSPALRLLLTGPGLLAGALLPIRARAQAVPALPSFFGTYGYTAYTVYDTTSPDEPTQVSGVGGTLALRPDGSYEKHMSILAPSGPYYFNQKGTFVLAGDSIRFVFTDLKGHDEQRGNFQFDPSTQRLTITILGYPVGNKGVYELMPLPPTPRETITPARPGKKHRR